MPRQSRATVVSCGRGARSNGTGPGPRRRRRASQRCCGRPERCRPTDGPGAQAAPSAGYFDKALDDLDYVLKANPDRVDALIYRASANRALDQLGPAPADIEKALAHAPSSAPALLERGNIRRLKGDVVGARQDWERVGQLAPGAKLTWLLKQTSSTLRQTRVPGRRCPIPLSAKSPHRPGRRGLFIYR